MTLSGVEDVVETLRNLGLVTVDNNGRLPAGNSLNTTWNLEQTFFFLQGGRNVLRRKLLYTWRMMD